MKLTILLLLPLLQTGTTNSDESDIHITTLKNPILPIQLGNAKIIYNKHTFLHFIDLEPIINQLKNIQNYFSKIKSKFYFSNATNPISYQGLSEGILLRTEFLIQTTQEKLNNLHPHIRSKRGLINIVGKANKWLFGTLDSDDEKRYNQAILNLQLNQKDILKELNLQTSLSKNLIDSYNKTITTLNSNQKKLEHSVKILQESVYSTINNNNHYISFQGVLYQVNLDCQNLITFIDNLEDAIMFAKLNILHNSILSSLELKQMINYVTNIYSESQIPKFKNVLSYYQFLGTQVTFSDTKLIFAIHIPIIRSETFTFYHLYPIIQNNKIFIPKYPYLAQKNKEIQFEESTCPSIEETHYCKESFHPIDECTIQIMESSSTTTGCQIIETRINQSVFEQITQEEVLVLPSQKERVLAQCKTNQYLEIEHPSLIKIPKSCHIETRNKKFVNDVNILPGKPLILPPLSITDIKAINSYKTPNYTKINFEEIYRLKDMANQLLPINKINQSTEHSIFWTITVVFCLSVLILWVATKKKSVPTNIKFWRKKSNQSAEKSNQSAETEERRVLQNRSSILQA